MNQKHWEKIKCKKYGTCEKDYSFNSSTCSSESSRYWKSIVYDSIIACDEIKNITESVPTNETSTILPNVMSTFFNKFWW